MMTPHVILYPASTTRELESYEVLSPNLPWRNVLLRMRAGNLSTRTISDSLTAPSLSSVILIPLMLPVNRFRELVELLDSLLHHLLGKGVRGRGRRR
jgi:hypothetical protein